MKHLATHSNAARAQDWRLWYRIMEKRRTPENSGEQPIFIDRNGRLFEYVLDYLRTGKVNLPSSVSRAAVKDEFKSYGLKFTADFLSENSDGIVYLDVGGMPYKVSRKTLQSCNACTKLSLLGWNYGNSIEDPFLIDRNGRLFEYVFDYLRTNKIYLPSSVSRAAIKEELDFYEICVSFMSIHAQSEGRSSGW